MFELKNGKMVVEAVCFTNDAGELIRLEVGSLVFIKSSPTKVEVDAIMSRNKKRTDHPDRGELVYRYKTNNVYKNVLDECRHVKTWSAMLPIIHKYYPNYSIASTKSCVTLYKRALTKGIPSVPLKPNKKPQSESISEDTPSILIP